ncbi:trigger factor [Propionicicella superfundia]|uniref:trigger factor n=1 Tax=Propionicicella superfundia TaxID=348582 RepID=UPI0003FE1560|nr:trigger factor [Propionicicella superfundia]
MSSTVEQLSPSKVKLVIEVPFSELEPHLRKAYKEIAEQVSIPGFRKGKVPPAIIDQRFGRGTVLQEAINAALPNAYGQAVSEQGLNPLGNPEIDVTKLEDGEVIEFTAEVEVRPTFDLPDFSAIAVEVKPQASVDDEVDARIEVMRKRFATTTDTDRAAKEGDQVVIDLLASQDGEPVEDGTAEGVTHIVGEPGMVDGLDEAIVGLKAGDSATFSTELAGGTAKGEKADIQVTVQKVQEIELPDVDDEWAQLVSEFDTVEEMRADLANGLDRVLAMDQLSDARDKVLEAAVELADFEVPEKALADEIEARTESITQQLGRAQLTLAQYLEQSDEPFADEDAFWADLAEKTATSIKAQLLLDTIADDRELSVEQHELTELLIRKAAQNNSTPEAEAQHMMEHNHLPEWMGEIRRNKALNVVLEAATVTDTDGEPVDVKDPYADLIAAATAAAQVADESGADESDADDATDPADSTEVVEAEVVAEADSE